MKVIDQYVGNGYQLINGDTCEVIRAIPDESVHFEVYSPPFSSLYLENNQTPEGIRIPKALVPYCGFEIID